MLYSLPIIMIECLIETLLIELLVAILLKIRSKKDLINIVLVNIITNPLVVSITLTVNVLYGLKYRYFCEGILEIGAFLIEAKIYKKVLKNKINPYLLSFILNLCSFLINKLIWLIF